MAIQSIGNTFRYEKTSGTYGSKRNAESKFSNNIYSSLMEHTAAEEAGETDKSTEQVSLYLAIQGFNHFVEDRIKNGPPKFQTGASELSIEEWEKLLKKVDYNLEVVQRAQEERVEEQKAPYSYLAEDGIITYKGVVFVCDDVNKSISLGDISNPKDVITIPLEGGGCLKVNRDNLEDLAKAIDMFSPRDIGRIMRAIAQDTKAQQARQEIEETKSESKNLLKV